MKQKIVFWVIFCAIGIVVGFRLTGMQIPASIIFITAAVTGVFGVFVFLDNTVRIFREWNRLFKKAPESQGDDSPSSPDK
jgi:uncharacterized membrane protein AbrB (regulator of aidB expression)